MKWNTAIKKIEKALTEDKTVEVWYHRKWCRNVNDDKIDIVEKIVEYPWNGVVCKSIITAHDGLDEGTHKIEEVIVKEITR